jgi:hypothetical protein
MIKDFVAQVKKDGMARTNRYSVLFTPPATVNPSSLQNMLLFCDQIQIPGLNYSTVQNRVFGEFRETPYEKLYDAINMSFYVDSGLKVKYLFDEWLNTINNPDRRTFAYYNDYISNMSIEVLDLQDKTRYEIVLYECYPKNIGSIQLDQSSKDVMRLQVTMQYKYWKSTSIEPLPDGQKAPKTFMEKFTKNFTGFQQEVNKVIGERAGNFVTGSLATYGVTKLPGLLRF